MSFDRQKWRREYRARPEVRAREQAYDRKRSRRRRENPEYRALQAEYQREWRKTRRGRKSLQQGKARYRAKPENREKELTYGRNYQRERRKDPEYRARQVRSSVDYERRRRAIDPTYRLMKNLRRRTQLALKAVGQSTSARRLLGCSPEEARAHLEAQFQTGMTWENYGLKGWHADHMRPLSSFNLTDGREAAEACHYTNLRPLWWRENIARGAKEV